MNICCLSGTIINEIEYNFFYNSKKHISKVEFILENKEIYKNNYQKITNLKLKAYDKKADYIYRNFKKSDCIYITGTLDEKMEIDVVSVDKVGDYYNKKYCCY